MTDPAELSAEIDSKHQSWLWKKTGGNTVKNLRKHGFDAHYVETTMDAMRLIEPMIAPFKSFGFGGSSTTRGLGIISLLKQQGKIVYDHWLDDISAAEDLDLRKKQGQCDCFFTSANAVSASGEIVNVDGVGNRTNAMCFGPAKVIIVAGMNKVTSDLHSALSRIKTIAGPMRAKSLGMDTPCAKSGICNDCNSPQRICRITATLHRKPMKTDISVILINKQLGF